MGRDEKRRERKWPRDELLGTPVFRSLEEKEKEKVQ